MCGAVECGVKFCNGFFRQTTTVLLRGTTVNRTYGTHKTYMFTYFYQHYLVLFTMPPRNSIHFEYVYAAALHRIGLDRIGLDWFSQVQCNAGGDLCEI